MKTTTPLPGRTRRLSTIAAVAAAITVFGGAQAALADPSPNAGPTAGGTVVSDVYPVGVDFTIVDGGGSTTTALGNDGLVYSWGQNSEGQIGDGTTTDRPSPTPVLLPAGVTFTDVSVGDQHALALGSDGLVYSWGANNYGQLGDGTTVAHSIPTVVSTPPGVTFTQVMAGRYHSLALASDGSAYAWGGDNNGRLGTGSTTPTSTPTPVVMPAGVTFAKLAAGTEASAAIASNGTVYAWGGNSVGTIGDGTNTDRLVPTLVSMPAGVTVTSLSVGDAHMVAVGSDGNTYAWGSNIFGQLGDGTLVSRNEPAVVTAPAGVTFTSIVAGSASTYALTAAGTAYAWGYNAFGQLGNGSTADSPVPAAVQMPSGVTFTTIGGGVAHAVAQGSDGNTYAWGLNFAGQVGDGTTTTRLTPVPVNRDIVITGVTFGGVPGTNLTQADGTWTITTPPGCGTVDVVVSWTLFDTTDSQTFPGGFVYGTAPVVTSQPGSASIVSGASTSLTAGASGDSSPTVQWQSAADPAGPWTDVAGATSTTLDVSPTATTSYRAVFTNCNGEAITEVGTVEVRVPAVVTPPVTTSPAGGAVGPRVNTGGDIQAPVPAPLDATWLFVIAGGLLAVGARWALKGAA
ncbi:Endoglucanase C [Microbacterium oxydans]|uniref:Endoglucanase C n=1 Tax=Microbacterium oxydans TaxID=82380 RepID=A0A3Q9J425_9MICO|nr:MULTISPECIES: RCC1 domain-containing protein [Microbacterium]AZS38904.1 Endoglucanase C [Microbacterium oxydans]